MVGVPAILVSLSVGRHEHPCVIFGKKNLWLI